MAFARPTLTEIVTRTESDSVSRLELTGALLRRSVTKVLARVVAGASHMLHGHVDWASRQIFPDTADQDNLLRFGRLRAIQPLDPAFATGVVDLTGTNGAPVLAGAVLRRADGAEYTTNAGATISGGVAAVAVTASVADAASNCDAGTLLTFESPVTGVDATATVNVDALGGGTDEETQPDYLSRVLDRMQNAPHGGNAADYDVWAKSVAGVTRVWVYPGELGAGTVVVRFVRDDDVGSIIPSGGEVTAVQTAIDALRPVTATVTVSAPVAAPVNYTFSSITPSTQAVKDAITAELTDLHLRVAEPGVALPISSIRTAIGNATGLTDYVLTSPSANVTEATGNLATLGTITFP